MDSLFAVEPKSLTGPFLCDRIGILDVLYSGFLMTNMSDLLECFLDPIGDELASKFLGFKETTKTTLVFIFLLFFLLKFLMGLCFIKSEISLVIR